MVADSEVDHSTAADTFTFTGADPGEGLDFSGDIVYAVDIRGPGGVTIGDAHFTDDSTTVGVTVTAENEILAWGDAIEFGDSGADDALESLMHSIRWSSQPNPITVTLANLEAGTEYRLQLLFHEQCCERGFDVFIGGQLVVDEYSPQRDQGGLSSGGRPGAAINYDFVAGDAGALTVTLDGSGSTFPDTNPILNALTLERNPGSSRPAEVDLSTAATTFTFTGADPGEGLDFSGNFLYAVDVCGPGGVTIGDAHFTDDSSVPGLSVSAQNEILEWGEPLDFGGSAGDDALELLMHSIRWSSHPAPLTVTMEVTPGVEYRLQLLFHEQCCSRGFDVLVDGQQIVDEYSPQRDQGGLNGGGRPGAAVDYDFVARSSTVTVSLEGTDAAFADTNPILNALTLEADPGSSRPAEVDLVAGVTTGLFTGADPGEGLDFSGNFLYAVDVCGPGGVTIGDAHFTDDSTTGGVTVVAQNAIPSWGAPLNFGTSPSDDALESVMQSIRWSSTPAPVAVTLGGLTRGAMYRLQLLFHEVRRHHLSHSRATLLDGTSCI